ncbi:MAG TPA: DHHA1 domain-containing protein, partial [Candidatus Acidoferrum sp.]|nr:DHHA1 domain-containing protein [Candidatus Acidoferrum sp.]
WRVEFACGGRAERLATDDLARQRALVASLSCAVEDLPMAIENLTAERDAHFKSLRSALQQLAEARAAQLVGEASAGANGFRLVAHVLDGVHPELLLPLATEIAKHERTVAMLILAESGQLVFAQHRAAGKDMAAILKSVLATHPGKGGGSKDFVRAKLADAAASPRALDLASRLARP